MSGLVVTTSQTTTIENFLAEAAKGKISFHTERQDGTLRKVHFLAGGTKERETAEWVAEQREAGATMRKIANELHLSVPSVRRMINDLALTEEFEQMDAEELEELLAGGQEAEDEDEAQVQANEDADAEGAMAKPLGA